MTNLADYRPRLSVDLRQDQFTRLQQILPFGTQKPLFQALVDGIIEAYERGGYDALGAIITKHISLQQVALIGEPYTKKFYSPTKEEGTQDDTNK